MKLRSMVAATALAAALACGGAASAAGAGGTTCTATELASPQQPAVLVKVRVNGAGPYTFVLDTGATASVVGSNLARSLALRPLAARLSGVGATGRFTAQASYVTLSIGDVHQRVLAGIIDLAQIRSVIGAVDGIVGYNFLKSYRVTIDYPHRQLCLGGA